MKSLNREDYLSATKNMLILHFSHKEIMAILKDVSDYFDEGILTGKSEQEICEEFGSPKLFAQKLKQDRPRQTWEVFFHWTLFIISILLFLHVWLKASQWECVVATIVFPFSLWNLFGGSALLEIKRKRNWTWEIIISVIGFLVVLFEQAMIALCNQNVTEMFVFIGKSYQVIFIIVVVILGGIIVDAFLLNRGYCERCCSIYIMIGVLYSSIQYLFFLRHFDAPSVKLYGGFLPFVIGSVCAGTVYFFLEKRHV